jgi:hypothetical protein
MIMKILKPTTQERTVMAAIIGIAFGLVVGVLSMREKVKDAEYERDLMMYHAEEMTEMANILMMQMEQKPEE